MELLTNIGWVVAAFLTGLALLALFMGIIIGIICILGWIVDLLPRTITDMRWEYVGMFFMGIVLGGTLFVLGWATLAESYATWGWPPVPEWMQMIVEEK